MSLAVEGYQIWILRGPDLCQFCREIDFVKESVRTLAGNGTKGSDYKGGGKGTSQARYARELIFDISFLFHDK